MKYKQQPEADPCFVEPEAYTIVGASFKKRIENSRGPPPGPWNVPFKWGA